MNDNLTIAYEEFPKEGITILTVGRGDEAIWVFHDNEAKAIYRLLTGEPKAIQAARFGLLLDVADSKNLRNREM